MRFVFLDNDTKMLFATAYDGEWDPYIDDFATKDSPTTWTCYSRLFEGWPGNSEPGGQGLDRPPARFRRRPGMSPIQI